MNIRIVTISAALVAAIVLPASASAETPAPNQGIYLGLQTGLGLLMPSDLDSPALTAAGLSDVELDFEPGVALDGAVGYAFDFGLRSEVAFGFRRNGLDSLSGKLFGVPFDGDAGGGDVTALSIMANFHYDFDVARMSGKGGRSKFVPFPGAGAGVVRLEVDSDLVDDDDIVPAWQVTAGLPYRVTPNVTLTGSYAFFSAVDPEFEGIEAEYLHHSLLAGIRYRF